MPRKPVEVAVNPAVLKWARESAGWTLPDISKKLKIDSDTLRGWEVGRGRPTLNALTSLAKYFRRPLAALLLPAPPQEPAPSSDFRSLPGRRGQLSPETLLAIQRARRLQSLAQELMRQMERPTSPRIGAASLQDSPDHLGAAERSRLGVELQDQIRWKHP